MTVKILADSASDLSSKLYVKLNVEVVPVHVFIGDEEYLDGVTIFPEKIYSTMRAGKRITTSQPSPLAFKDAFMNSAETNQPLIYFALSSELSGTYASAKVMEQQVKDEFPDAPIHIIDTKCVSIGYGLVIIRAANLAKKGATVEEIIDIGTYHANHMEHIFTVDNLEYLRRSGRLSRTVSVIGSLLRIKPILHIEHGKIEVLENMRGSKRLFSRMLEIAEERGTDFKNQVLGICHADNLPAAEQLAALCREKLKPKDVLIEKLGAAIGTHAGPGVLALVFLNKPYK